MAWAIKELPGAAGGRLGVATEDDRGAEASWRIVRYLEEPDEATAMRERWKHPARRPAPRVRYAVEVDGERMAWGLRSRDAAVRWLTRLKRPVQLTVQLAEAEERDEMDEWDDLTTPELVAA